MQPHKGQHTRDRKNADHSCRVNKNAATNDVGCMSRRVTPALNNVKA